MLVEEEEPLIEEPLSSQAASITFLSIMLMEGAEQTEDLPNPSKHTYASTVVETHTQIIYTVSLSFIAKLI